MASISKMKMFIAALFISAATVASVVALEYFSVLKEDPPLSSAVLTLIPESGKLRLGSKLEIRGEFRLPWHRRPLKVSEPRLPKGWQFVAPPVLSRKSLRWGYSTWEMRTLLQPYRQEALEDMSFSVRISDSKKYEGENVLFEIPDVEVRGLETDSDRLSISGTVSPGLFERLLRRPWFWPAVGIILILTVAAAALLVLLIRKLRDSQKHEPSASEKALAKLAELRGELRNSRITAQAGVAELSDIVRGFLEDILLVRVPGQTTTEFLGRLRETGGGLRKIHRDFLDEFMRSADLVKFAGFPADIEHLLDAADKAEQLFRVPGEDADETGGAGQ